MMKCIFAIAVLLAGTTFSASAAPEKISENKQESMKVEITEGQIDVISGLIYSQVISTRSNRALRMTVLVPRTRTPKPAIVYFPGGGFTSADYEKFIEMRMALAKAGFVVAAAEYRTVPDKFPALVVDGKAAVRFLRAHAAQFHIDPTRIGVWEILPEDICHKWWGRPTGKRNSTKGIIWTSRLMYKQPSPFTVSAIC